MPKAAQPLKRPWVKQRTITERYDDSTEFNYHSLAWRKDRLAHLMANPLCAECLKRGLTVEASVSDHIKPISQGGDAWDWANRQSLCYPCHQSKSAKDRYNKVKQ